MMTSIALSRKKFGFTLIELMIVVAIIGILSAVAIPKFAEMLRKAREATTKGGLNHLRSALTIYVSDNEGLYPTDDLNCLNIKYIDSLPFTKITPYHPDTNTVRRSSMLGCAAIFSADSGEWAYCNESDRSYCGPMTPTIPMGRIWILCTHTDSKNARVTSW